MAESCQQTESKTQPTRGSPSRERNFADVRVQDARETVREAISTQGGAARVVMDSGFSGSPAFIVGGAAHRPVAPPPRIPFPAAESLVAPVRPSPKKDGFSIDGNNRNTI